MNKFIKDKGATILVVVATVILAGVAIFTALRLYQVRQQAVSPASPESRPEAASGWEECRIGTPTHNTQVCRERAEAFKGTSGPSGGDDSAWFTWGKNPPNPLSGDTLCGLAPSVCTGGTNACVVVNFVLEEETPTPTTPKTTITLTPSPTNTVTPSPTNTVTNTPGPSATPTSSPTPTTKQVGGPSATITPTKVPVTSTTLTPSEPELPPAGVGMPTLIATAIGGLLILLSLVLAF
ncbi:hypothetical protein IPM62_00105 [Candidatus Woesebacteria bacterium]|nr:MAG: hypothetical protein IPM62_00105 [Candidatus Woesebacteria bacterium]